LLLLVSGLIAYVGDYIGRAIGRRRLSLLRLRPRYTAIAFTVITGVLIALVSVLIILALSQNARLALFGLEALQNNLAQTRAELSASGQAKAELDRELKKMRQEIFSLEKAKQKLTKEIEVSRKGKVLFNVDEVLITSVIQAGPDKKKLEKGLLQLLSAADTYVRSFGVKKTDYLIYLAPEEFDQAVQALSESRLENIVVVRAAENVLFGEQVPVHFKIYENKRLYLSGEVIAEVAIPAGLSVAEIQNEIKKLLYQTRLNAEAAGVLPDPTGSVGSLPYSEINTNAKKIKAYNKAVKVRSVAKKDIYPLGPVALELKVLYL
jgi:uncharacterized protein (DUF3084 family)